MRRLLNVALIALMLLPTGCVMRKLFLRTNPPGALVYIDGVAVGTTPYEGEFLSYGVRKVEFVLPGHARQQHVLHIDMPWWQWMPFDIVTELLWPWDIVDERFYEVSLQPTDASQTSWDDARAAHERLLEWKADNPPPPPQGTDGER